MIKLVINAMRNGLSAMTLIADSCRRQQRPFMAQEIRKRRQTETDAINDTSLASAANWASKRQFTNGCTN